MWILWILRVIQAFVDNVNNWIGVIQDAGGIIHKASRKTCPQVRESTSPEKIIPSFLLLQRRRSSSETGMTVDKQGRFQMRTFPLSLVWSLM